MRIQRLRKYLSSKFQPDLSEHGQVLILFVAVFTVLLALAAFSIDQGLWYSDRRVAQKDADASARAGASKLLAALVATGSVTNTDLQNASTRALRQAADNGAPPPTSETIPFDAGCDYRTAPTTCGSTNKCQSSLGLIRNAPSIQVAVRRPGAALFSRVFSAVSNTDVAVIGARATACVGAASGPSNIVPLEVDITGPCFIAGEPVFTRVCPIEYGSGTNPGGELDLDAPGDACSDAFGSGDVENQLAGDDPVGICKINPNTFCDPAKNGSWYDCVAVQTGNPPKILNGANRRIAKEDLSWDACDLDGNGIDDFAETIEVVIDSGNPTTSIYEAKDCDPNTPGVQPSPRLINIIVLKNPPSGSSNSGQPIYGFAGFYLEGCKAAKKNDPFPPEDKKCAVVNNVGHLQILGKFVNLLLTDADIGPINDSTTLFSITLVK